MLVKPVSGFFPICAVLGIDECFCVSKEFLVFDFEVDRGTAQVNLEFIHQGGFVWFCEP